MMSWIKRRSGDRQQFRRRPFALVEAAHPGAFDRADVYKKSFPPSSGWINPKPF
jgi:hypothetical protein